MSMMMVFTEEWQGHLFRPGNPPMLPSPTRCQDAG